MSAKKEKNAAEQNLKLLIGACISNTYGPEYKALQTLWQVCSSTQTSVRGVPADQQEILRSYGIINGAEVKEDVIEAVLATLSQDKDTSRSR
jgi:UTP-glucose-1-phosphate uridylyltransferase